MRYAEITLIVELSEDITTKEREGALMDDISDTLTNVSEFVSEVRFIDIKDCTAKCETGDPA